MKKSLLLFITGLIIFSLISCAQPEGQAAQPDYEDTKKMVIDMLKTDEGKDAIKEVLSDEEVQQEIVMEQTFVRKTIQQTLISEEGKEFWQETMQDPEFAKALAESMQEVQQKLLKDLMKDPEYQEMMMEILKDPEMEEAAVELLKSKDYRKEVMNIMSDAFESPYFVAKVNEILLHVAKDQTKQAAQGGGGGEEEGGEEGQ